VVSRSRSDVVVVLTDGEAVYDVRGITVGELGQLNETAQQETEGELWWRVVEANDETVLEMQQEKV
jgi:hypothetical protein